MYKGKKKKASNRSLILECIYRQGPIARTDIAEETEITPATVTMNVSSLIREGFIKELGEVSTEEASSGRKRILIDLVPERAYAMGIEFTQKALSICITDLKGRVHHQRQEPFSRELTRHINDRIVDGVCRLLEESGLPRERVTGLGIAVPGHMDESTSSLATNQETWKHFDPKKIDKGLDMPVVYENNARCMALGQYLFYPEVSPDSFAFFHIGLGMFCANVVEGEIFLGNNYVAGEVGHTIIVNEGGRRCECGKYGCLQTYASESWLLKSARLLYKNSPNTILKSLVTDADGISLDTIATAYSMGDPVITTHIATALKYLGITASNIAIITDPGKLFLHGQLFNYPDIRKELMDFIQRQLVFVNQTYAGNVEILPCSPTDGAVGASALAIRQFFIRGEMAAPL